MNTNELKTLKGNFLLVTKTKVKLNKKDKAGNKNELPELFKVSYQEVILGADYETAVNEALQQECKEADFKAGSRTWGERDGNFVIKGDSTYLSCILVKNVSKHFEDADGEHYEEDSFKQFYPAKKESNGQGLDNAVQYRNYKMENVIAFMEIIGDQE